MKQKVYAGEFDVNEYRLNQIFRKDYESVFTLTCKHKYLNDGALSAVLIVSHSIL